MKNILILGAGRSATSLIQYLAQRSSDYGWNITLAEKDPSMLEVHQQEFPAIRTLTFDVDNEKQLAGEVEKAHLVISMLPAILHLRVARCCADLGTNMITASYMTPEIEALSPKFEEKGAVLLMEMGLDPGIDHMSAMKTLDKIKEEGHQLTGFETFTGGLLADSEDNENPWRYKFTWNPRNVVLAGTGNVKFLQEGRYKYIPYHKLFQRTEVIHIPGYGYFEGYANRDSLKYLDLYQLNGIRTLYRGTLRRPGFCNAWNGLVQLGVTDDTYQMEGVGEMTHRQFINSFLSFNAIDSVELKMAHYLNVPLESEEMFRYRWLGLFEEVPLGLETGSPAEILEHILKKKWTLRSDEPDMIVMWHKFDYLVEETPRQVQSHMVIIGENATDTAMSKAVGWPLAIAAKMILQGDLHLQGTHIPTNPALYKPILEELETLGFEFSEREVFS